MQTYCASLSFSFSSHFIYECVIDINHTPFERGENILSADNKIFFLERIYWRDIRVDILYRSFIEKCGFVLRVSLFFYCVVSFKNVLWKYVIYDSKEKKKLYILVKKFSFSILLLKRNRGQHFAPLLLHCMLEISG